MTTELWDANAIEKVDDLTIRLNGTSSQLAIPENLFHYPALILHPKDEGKWGVGAIGSGAYDPVEVEVGKKVVLKRRGSYWKEGGHLDEIHFVDLATIRRPSWRRSPPSRSTASMTPTSRSTRASRRSPASRSTPSPPRRPASPA